MGSPPSYTHEFLVPESSPNQFTKVPQKAKARYSSCQGHCLRAIRGVIRVQAPFQVW